MTDTIQELREKIERATKGPWSWRIEPQLYPECDDADYPATISGDGKHLAFLPERCDEHLNQVNDRDAALIVAAVNALPSLLDRLTAAEARNRVLEEALKPFAEAADGVSHTHKTAFVYVKHLRAARNALRTDEGESQCQG